MVTTSASLDDTETDLRVPALIKDAATPMRLCIRVLTLSISIGLLAESVSSQDIGPTGPIPYDIVESWAKPFAGEGFAF